MLGKNGLENKHNNFCIRRKKPRQFEMEELRI